MSKHIRLSSTPPHPRLIPQFEEGRRDEDQATYDRADAVQPEESKNRKLLTCRLSVTSLRKTTLPDV